MRERFLGVFFAAVAVFGMAFAIGTCTDKAPIPTVSPVTQPAAPPHQAVTPQVVTGGHVTPAENNKGLRVEIIHDDWDAAYGPSCHGSGGTRTYRLTNERDVLMYSNLSAFTADVATCGTQQKTTGQPNHSGCTEIKPGETCDYSVTVHVPKGDDGICTLQVDDTWGPGGMREGSFVVGDSFRVPDSKCEKICVEDPKERSATECGDWNECHEHPQASTGNGKVCKQEKECVETKTIDYVCKPDVTTTREWEETKDCDCSCTWRGKFCVTYLSNSGDEYRILDDGQVWKSGLSLSRGNQNTCWSHSLDNSNLCLWWKGEKIDCARAKCSDVEAAWHGSVRFRCVCD